MEKEFKGVRVSSIRAFRCQAFEQSNGRLSVCKVYFNSRVSDYELCVKWYFELLRFPSWFNWTAVSTWREERVTRVFLPFKRDPCFVNWIIRRFFSRKKKVSTSSASIVFPNDRKTIFGRNRVNTGFIADSLCDTYRKPVYSLGTARTSRKLIKPLNYWPGNCLRGVDTVNEKI